MSILAWIVLGLIAGFIASKLVNRTGGSLILDLLLGVVRSRGATLAMITHEPLVAASCGRRVKIVDGRIASDHA